MFPFTNASYTPANTDTAATIVAAATEFTAYSEPTRPAWTGAHDLADMSRSNYAAPSTITLTADALIQGMCLVSAQAKSATSGVLFSTAKQATARQWYTGDVMSLQYKAKIVG